MNESRFVLFLFIMEHTFHERNAKQAQRPTLLS